MLIKRRRKVNPLTKIKNEETEKRAKMLTNLLGAKTLSEKREVIKQFNPYFYIFGTTLDWHNPYEGAETL